MNNIKKISCLIAITLLPFSTNSFAYLDPGTGSIFVQAIISAVSLGLGAVAFYWQRFISLFKRKKTKAEDALRSSNDDKK